MSASTSPVNDENQIEDLRSKMNPQSLVNEAVILAIRKKHQQLERQHQEQIIVQHYQSQQQREQQDEALRESSDGSPSATNDVPPSPPPPVSLPPPPTSTILVSSQTPLAGPVFSVIENQILHENMEAEDGVEVVGGEDKVR